MPEGPSLVILREEVEPLFTGEKVISVSGNSKLDIQRAKGKRVEAFHTWGKHFLIRFDDFTFRIHFMLWGSYRINESKESTPRLSLKFPEGELNIYASSVKILEEDLDELYDWEADVMSDQWNPKKAEKKLLEQPDMLATDALLNQDIFAGVGNIIKNEVLFRIKVDPRSKVGKLPKAKFREMIKEAREYSFDFYRWKKKYELRKHWKVHRQKTCPDCESKLVLENLGKTNRRTFYCPGCQKLYN